MVISHDFLGKIGTSWCNGSGSEIFASLTKSHYVHTSFLMISGAKYSGVPQNVLVVSFPASPSFDKPKSVNLI